MNRDVMHRLMAGETLTESRAYDAFIELMAGEWSDVVVASFLTALRVRGETVDEIVGAARAMKQNARSIVVGRTGLLDTCGTGGDQAGLFNVSTACAIVVSATGVPVAKHGNRGFSSKTGSADVLKELGVHIEADDESVLASIRQDGLGFLFAPAWHPAMKRVAGVRKELGFRSIFNFLGPLSNPAGVDFQLIGVSSLDWAGRIAEAVGRLGIRSATVVVGSDGLDEVTLAGPTRAFRWMEGIKRAETWTPADFDLPTSSLETCLADSPAESAALIRGVLAGNSGPALDLVLANSAVALLTAGRVGNLPAGVGLAREAILSGAAAKQLDKLIRNSQPKQPEGKRE